MLNKLPINDLYRTHNHTSTHSKPHMTWQVKRDTLSEAHEVNWTFDRAWILNRVFCRLLS